MTTTISMLLTPNWRHLIRHRKLAIPQLTQISASEAHPLLVSEVSPLGIAHLPTDIVRGMLFAWDLIPPPKGIRAAVNCGQASVGRKGRGAVATVRPAQQSG